MSAPPKPIVELDAWKSQAKAGNATTDILLRKYTHATEVKQVEGENLTLDFIISSAAVDRDNDTVDPNGWDFSFWKQSPVVLWSHLYDEPSVAKGLSIGQSGSLITARAEFTPQDLYPFGYMIYRMLVAHFLRATSVGFSPRKYVWNEERGAWAVDYLEQELYEFSVCTVGSNRDSLMLRNAKSAGIDVSPMVEWCSRLLDQYDPSVVRMPRGEIEAAYRFVAGDKSISLPTFALKGVAPEDVMALFSGAGKAQLVGPDGKVLRELSACEPTEAAPSQTQDASADTNTDTNATASTEGGEAEAAASDEGAAADGAAAADASTAETAGTESESAPAGHEEAPSATASADAGATGAEPPASIDATAPAASLKALLLAAKEDPEVRALFAEMTGAKAAPQLPADKAEFLKEVGEFVTELFGQLRTRMQAERNKFLEEKLGRMPG